MNQVEKLLRDNRAACVRTFGDAHCWVLLVSGDDAALQAWAFLVWPEVFDRRGHTCRVRLWIPAGASEGDEMAALLNAVQHARDSDVTLQMLCVGAVDESTREEHDLGGGASASVASHHETYPVLHLATHRKGWFPGGVAAPDVTEATAKQETG